ncbi:MAG: DUF4214 domain-containing protein, partial [Bryobacteraceae bacterium]|nr:DUF4214 domain-containing protein [Bryobacteraceae bacterium]
TGQGTGTTNYTILPNFSSVARNGSITVNNLTVPVQQAPAAGAMRQRLVRSLYYNTLGRIPTQAEEDFQVNSNLSTLDLTTNFFTSQEFAQSGKLVSGLYIALLDRDAEYAGWIFQRNALSSRALNQVQLTGNFLGSLEYTQRFGAPTVNEFVRLLYQNVLGRVPSAAEEAFQVNAVNAAGRATVATNFMGVEEFRVGRLPRFDSFLVYAAILNRDPTPAERQLTKSRLESGVSIGTILQEIVSSAEFTQLLQ